MMGKGQSLSFQDVLKIAKFTSIHHLLSSCLDIRYILIFRMIHYFKSFIVEIVDYNAAECFPCYIGLFF